MAKADYAVQSSRVRALEAQVAELEADSAKLLQALEAQKALTSDADSLARRKGEEAANQLNLKVCTLPPITSTNGFLTRWLQATEIDGLKQRLKQYSDYDEIKRELEIMKVSKSYACGTCAVS